MSWRSVAMRSRMCECEWAASQITYLFTHSPIDSFNESLQPAVVVVVVVLATAAIATARFGYIGVGSREIVSQRFSRNSVCMQTTAKIFSSYSARIYWRVFVSTFKCGGKQSGNFFIIRIIEVFRVCAYTTIHSTFSFHQCSSAIL